MRFWLCRAAVALGSSSTHCASNALFVEAKQTKAHWPKTDSGDKISVGNGTALSMVLREGVRV